MLDKICAHWHTIEYNPKKQKEIICDILTESSEYGLRQILKCCLTFKSPSFASEQEVRFIKPHLEHPTRYRPGKNGIITLYIEWDFSS